MGCLPHTVFLLSLMYFSNASLASLAVFGLLVPALPACSGGAAGNESADMPSASMDLMDAWIGREGEGVLDALSESSLAWPGCLYAV